MDHSLPLVLLQSYFRRIKLVLRPDFNAPLAREIMPICNEYIKTNGNRMTFTEWDKENEKHALVVLCSYYTYVKVNPSQIAL